MAGLQNKIQSNRKKIAATKWTFAEQFIFDPRFKIWCKGWGGWDQFHSQTDIILVLTYSEGKIDCSKNEILFIKVYYEDSKNAKFIKIFQQEVGSLLVKCILELLPILFGKWAQSYLFCLWYGSTSYEDHIPYFLSLILK